MIEYEDLLGVPFVYGGRSKKEGFDCYGLVMEIYQRNGIVLPEYASTDKFSLIHQAIHEAKPLFIEIERPEALCVVTFKIRPPYTSHIGVVMPEVTRFIHIMMKRSVAVERLEDDCWKRRITGFFRWRN